MSDAAATQINFDDLMTEMAAPIGEAQPATAPVPESTTTAQPAMTVVANAAVETDLAKNDADFTDDSVYPPPAASSAPAPVPTSVTAAKPQLNVVNNAKDTVPAAASGAEKNGSLSIDMSGNVCIDLKLNFGEKSIYVSCDEEGLLLTLSDGSSFKIPLK